MTCAEDKVLKFMDLTSRRFWERRCRKGWCSGFLGELDNKSWEAEGWVRKSRTGGARLEARTQLGFQGGPQIPLTPTASLKQEDLGAASQGPTAVQLLHQRLWLHLLPVSSQ